MTVAAAIAPGPWWAWVIASVISLGLSAIWARAALRKMSTDARAHRILHPSRWLRIILSTITTWWLWQQQGRPRDMPVIVRPGRLIAGTDGRGTISYWHFDSRYQRQPISVNDLWDRLSALVPVERPR